MAQQPPPPGPIVVPPEEFRGRWANAVTMVRTPHEFTLDFVRMAPTWERGMVVARVSFSALLLSQLVTLVNDHWDVYTREAGIPPDTGIPPESERDD